MKHVLFYVATLLVLQTFMPKNAMAKIWRVNNRSNYNASSLWGDNVGGTASYPVFNQVNQAVTFGIVNNNDTIHIEGSTGVYTDATITKKLVIIGPGYFLTENPATGSSTLDSKISKVVFSTGSDGSLVIGLNVVNDGASTDGIVYVNVNGITVKRCRIERYVRFETLLTDVFIIQNFFPNIFNTNCIAANGASTFVPPTDVVFNNNICQKTLTWGTPLVNPASFWPLLQCKNNVFDGPDNLATPNLAFSTSDFSNNILMPNNAIVNIAASAGVIHHNIATLSSQFGTADNNLVVAAINTIFVGGASTDGFYRIVPASVAANSGSDATDRGAYGGAAITSRYHLSGLSSIPVIYEIITSGVANASGLPVTIKAKIIN